MATIREFFQNLLYQVPAIGITDIVDILVVSIIFYSLLRLIRSTSAARVARAILLLLAITLLTDVLNLYTLNWLLNKILEVGAIALIIVFQPELRRALERVGAQLHFHLLSTESAASIEQSAVNATVQACEIMSRERVGVLLVFERETPLDEYFKTGTIVDAQLSEQLLRNLFFKNSPLHDGAVIVRGGRVAAAGCVMPLIVSVLAAMCLWVYVMTVVNPDVDLVIGNIPVTFSGAEVLQEDHGLVITGDYQEFVSVHFYGKNADLKTLDQHKDEIKAVVDVSKVRSTKEYTMTYDITLPSAVSASSITRADKTPTSITFTVERQIRKSVEVKGDFSNVRIAEGFMLDSTSFDYDSITVEGPESIVGTIDCAQVTLDRSNVDKTITETVSYVLLDKDGNQVDTSGLTLSADAVEVTMKIVKYKVVPLEVEFIDGGGAKAETDVTYTADIQAVTLSGDVTVLDGLNSIQLEPIDLSTLSSNDETITRTILIPNDVKNVSGQEEVSIHVIIHGKQIKTLRTTNIVFIGVNEEKFKATSLSQQVQVTIRADASDAQKILAGNIRIVADMSGYTQEGTYQVPVSVYVDGYDSAGAIGQYSIAANLAPATAEE